MKTLKFKSNIKCTGCVTRVTPALDNAPGVEKWEVNIHVPEKTLTVETDTLNADEVRELVEKAGFKAEPL
jgi:copper chaperone